MRVLFCIFSFVTLAGCTSLGGVMSSETTWFQDWSCDRQDGVCARTDTIDAITISELDSDPAEAGPVSGYPEESLPLSATPKKLRGIQPLDKDYFDGEIDRGRPFLETSFGDAELLAAPAMLGEPTFSLDSAFDEPPALSESPPDSLFGAAFPQAAIGEQFAVLRAKMRIGADTDPASSISASSHSNDVPRITRTVVRRDGVLVPEGERVTELVSPPPTSLASDAGETRDEEVVLAVPVAIETGATLQNAAPNEAPKTPRRSNAKVLPVIISPYVDARGIYHERSVIWVEVEAADWVVE